MQLCFFHAPSSIVVIYCAAVTYLWTRTESYSPCNSNSFFRRRTPSYFHFQHNLSRTSPFHFERTGSCKSRHRYLSNPSFLVHHLHEIPLHLHHNSLDEQSARHHRENKVISGRNNGLVTTIIANSFFPSPCQSIGSNNNDAVVSENGRLISSLSDNNSFDNKIMDVHNNNNFDVVDLIQHATLQPYLDDSASSSSSTAASPILSQAVSFPSEIITKAFPAIFHAITHVISSISSFIMPLTSSLMQTSMHLQRLGETLFATFLLLSVVQALVAMYQYRYDVRGQLVFPTGLTMGVEDYFGNDGGIIVGNSNLKNSERVTVNNNSKRTQINTSSTSNARGVTSSQVSAQSKEDNKNNTEIKIPATISTKASEESLSTKILKKMNKSLLVLLPFLTRKIHVVLTRNTHLFHIGFIVTLVSLLEDVLKTEEKDEETEGSLNENGAPTISGKYDGNSSSWRWNLDFRNLFGGKSDSGNNTNNSIEGTQRKDTSNAKTAATTIPSLINKLANGRDDPLKVLVLGDSLAIGIGCIDIFDDKKNQTLPMALVENTKPPSIEDVVKQDGSEKSPQPTPLQGPVFPQILARTLSFHFQQPVQWRSAGVDGGDVNDIRTFCMDVLKQECDGNSATARNTVASHSSGGPPDVIVCLFGMNDLKKLLSVNLFQLLLRQGESGGMARGFRRGMESLLSDIHKYAPDAYVVFPALPIQTFHKNSIINIVPLGLLVDSVMVFWEGQKKRVAEAWNRKGRHTMYTDLTAKEIAGWYHVSNPNSNDEAGMGGDNQEARFINDEYDNVEEEDMLLSADGVHPNKRMYAKWAESVGNKFFERIGPELVEKTHAKKPRLIGTSNVKANGAKLTQSHEKQEHKSGVSN